MKSLRFLRMPQLAIPPTMLRIVAMSHACIARFRGRVKRRAVRQWPHPFLADARLRLSVTAMGGQRGDSSHGHLRKEGA